MKYIVPVNNYIVVEPSGDVKGFKELSDARGFISSINLDNILENTKVSKHAINDMYQEQDQNELGIITGVDKGESKIYNIEEVIEKIRKQGYFESEKEELISKLLESEIKLNVYHYGIDDILSDLTEEWNI